VTTTAAPAGLPSRLAELRRCLVMAVVNTTPDSFSDGGRFADPADAVRHGLAQASRGADVVDVGGESTRPGASRVTVAEELARVLPVVVGLTEAGVPVSVDTMRAEVAAQAVAAGAVLVNDVSGGMADPEMLPFLAGVTVPVVLMHWRGHSSEMMSRTGYTDVVADVRDEVAERVAAAVTTGVAEERIVVDPGIGFAKEPSDNWPLLARLDALQELGRPVLVGASRKRFLGEVLADADGPRPVDRRDDATAAVSALAAAAGAWCVRVHDAAASADAVRVAAAWTAAQVRP
jgi:dihydropteroate synthase